MEFKKSLEHLERAKRVVPLASQTFSKCYTQLSVGAAPLFLDRGVGGRVWDLDGNEYVDQVLALAPIVLGYQYPAVEEAVLRQLKKGIILSLPGTLEAEVAEAICEVVPCAEMVRYGKNGSDVTAAAVRIARAYTGRDLVACGGYHGWQDWYIGTTTRNKGVPVATRELAKAFTYNDIASLERIFSEHPNQVAAVILEPIGVEWPKDNFLEKVRELCTRHGAVLIFDEMITGFRLALGGAQTYFKVTPDLACFGKAVANGYPVSVITGKRELMQLCEEIFFSFTFGGELVSLAAAAATINELRTKPVNEYINRIGDNLRDQYNALAQEMGLAERTKAVGYGAHHVLQFLDEKGDADMVMKTVFQETMVQNGVLTIASNNTCFTHTDDDCKQIVNAYRAALSEIKDAREKGDLAARVRGRVLEPVFRKP